MIGTSGWSRWSTATPSGAATTQTKVMAVRVRVLLDVRDRGGAGPTCREHRIDDERTSCRPSGAASRSSRGAAGSPRRAPAPGTRRRVGVEVGDGVEQARGRRAARGWRRVVRERCDPNGSSGVSTSTGAAASVRVASITRSAPKRRVRARNSAGSVRLSRRRVSRSAASGWSSTVRDIGRILAESRLVTLGPGVGMMTASCRASSTTGLPTRARPGVVACSRSEQTATPGQTRGFLFPGWPVRPGREVRQMVVVMKQDATDADIEAVAEKARAAGGEAFVSRGRRPHGGRAGRRHRAASRRSIGASCHGVDHVIQIGKAYKMVARDLHPEPTSVKVGLDRRSAARRSRSSRARARSRTRSRR